MSQPRREVRIRKKSIERLFLIRKPDISRLMTIPVRNFVLWIYFWGVMFIFYSTLAPWPLWPFWNTSPFLVFIPIILSLLMSQFLREPLFTRQDWRPSFAAYLLCALTIAILNDKNVFGLLGEFFTAIVFLSFFLLNKKDLVRLGDVLSKSMAIILIPSMLAFGAYLLGLSGPHRHVEMGDGMYTFDNYYLFLIDDRFALNLIPRFHSIFLEPAHMALCCVTLLLTQVGQWRRWYNVSMIVALFISFSLAGYILFVFIILASTWMRRKPIAGKLTALVVILSLTTVFVMNYNGGENMVNELIVHRMEMNDDGELEGDNRVTDDFKKTFENFLRSDKVLTGVGFETFKRETAAEAGNAGFRVFLYCNGFLSFFLLIVFFFTFLSTSRNKRGITVVVLFHAISFIPHAIPLRVYVFLPLYIVVFREVLQSKSPFLKSIDDESNQTRCS